MADLNVQQLVRVAAPLVGLLSARPAGTPDACPLYDAMGDTDWTELRKVTVGDLRRLGAELAAIPERDRAKWAPMQIFGGDWYAADGSTVVGPFALAECREWCDRMNRSLTDGTPPPKKGCPITAHHPSCDCEGAGGDR